MQTSLVIKNIVLLGAFDPSKFDKFFFIKHNIVSEDQILGGSVFDAIGGKQLVTEYFNIVISLNQIIISDSKPERDNNKISEIFNLLLSTSTLNDINALGLNFYWNLSEDGSIENLTRSLFYNEKSDLLNKFFSSENSMFGTYASTDFKDSRLKLDIKPQVLTTMNSNLFLSTINVVNFSFNFHFDVKGKSLDIFKIIGDYEEYNQKGKEMISIF